MVTPALGPVLGDPSRRNMDMNVDLLEEVFI